MDNYPTEFTDLQKRPNDELQGKRSLHLGNLYKVLCTEFPLLIYLKLIWITIPEL